MSVRFISLQIPDAHHVRLPACHPVSGDQHEASALSTGVLLRTPLSHLPTATVYAGHPNVHHGTVERPHLGVLHNRCQFPVPLSRASGCRNGRLKYAVKCFLIVSEIAAEGKDLHPSGLDPFIGSY